MPVSQRESVPSLVLNAKAHAGKENKPLSRDYGSPQKINFSAKTSYDPRKFHYLG
jgi:hypothetical protein